jgi:hypothetical protein
LFKVDNIVESLSEISRSPPLIKIQDSQQILVYVMTFMLEYVLVTINPQDKNHDTA